jgi:hypothetical protein
MPTDFSIDGHLGQVPALHAHAFAARTGIEPDRLARRLGLAYSGVPSTMRDCQMSTRTASVNRKIAANGQALHRAMMRRMESAGADKEPSAAEAALIEERRLLKEERAKRKERALQPGPSALDRLVRTHHPQAKHNKDKKKTHDADASKKPKHAKTRAEKHAEKAAAAEAARRAPKKPVKPEK